MQIFKIFQYHEYELGVKAPIYLYDIKENLTSSPSACSYLRVLPKKISFILVIRGYLVVIWQLVLVICGYSVFRVVIRRLKLPSTQSSNSAKASNSLRL